MMECDGRVGAARVYEGERKLGFLGGGYWLASAVALEIARGTSVWGGAILLRV